MNHLEEGLLLAVRDGESVEANVRKHLDACGTCRTALEAAERRAADIDAFLGGDTPRMRTDEAKRRVRARLDVEREQGARHHARFRHARRAAAILALSAGAVYAVPGSPVPGWLGLAGDAGTGHVVGEPAPAPTAEEDGQELLLVPAGDGIEVVLEDVAPGTDVELVWLPGTSARIAAGAGARYSIAEGRAVATGGEGPVRIGIPRTAPRISITINGRMVYEGTSEDGEARDVERRSSEGIVFLASQ